MCDHAMKQPVLLDAPNVGALEKRYLCRAIDEGYVSTAGPFVPRFEDAFASYLRLPCAVSTQSGTAALHSVLHELGIGPGDEVIVPVMTFIATVNPVMQTGARPVFVDVDPETWNIDPSAIERAVTRRTRAIIPVHLYGNPCDMSAITGIARRHGLKVIEDAAESLGALYKGRFTGTWGDFGCFSFNGNKVITTGGGGMVVGKSVKQLKHIKFLVNQARDESRGYYHPEVGFNYRMTNIEASVGLAQLERLGSFLTCKKKSHEIYKRAFDGNAAVRLQREQAEGISSWWMTSAVFPHLKDVEPLQLRLRAMGIPTRRIFMPITLFPPYKTFASGRYPNAEMIYRKGLCLPSSTRNTLASVRNVAAMLNTAI